MHPELLVTAHREAGLTLIEVLVSLVLLTVALLGLTVSFPQSRYAVETGNQFTTAIGLARQTIESMHNQRYTQALDPLTAANYPAQAYGSIPNFSNFRRNVLIEDGVPEATCTPPPPTPCTKRVTVSVFFKDNTGTERAARVATIFVR